MKPLIFLNSHPIQYFVPLYKQITTSTTICLQVMYCSEAGLKSHKDSGFGTNIQWDIPLLNGYSSIFFRNYAITPSLNSFWGLFNPGIISFLWKQPRSVVVIHGWGSLSNILAIIAAKVKGHIVCLRAETPWHQEKMKNKWVTSIKHIYLRCLFTLVDCFLFIGMQNRLFYKKMHVPDNRLYFAPYCVDNFRFSSFAEEMNKAELKALLYPKKQNKMILYSGKYTVKKRPLDLIAAFIKLNRTDIMLVMVGEGELRPQMEQMIRDNNVREQVMLTGFINQSNIARYYAVADVFVMCSGLGETWGLSVNEAMNFNLPLVVSDSTGCSFDLVKEGSNGYIFPEGDIDALANAINKCLHFTEEEQKKVSEINKSLLETYSYTTIIHTLNELCNN